MDSLYIFVGCMKCTVLYGLWCVSRTLHLIYWKLLTLFYPGNYAQELIDFQAGPAHQGAVDVRLSQ